MSLNILAVFGKLNVIQCWVKLNQLDVPLNQVEVKWSYIKLGHVKLTKCV